jgi:hypothetical protein
MLKNIKSGFENAPITGPLKLHVEKVKIYTQKIAFSRYKMSIFI